MSNNKGNGLLAERENKTIYRDGDRVVKVFETGYSKGDVLREAMNQARVEETGLNIPAVLEVSVVDGKWAIISQFIEGKTLQQLIDEHPKQKNKYLERFVDIQMEMRLKDAPELGLLRDKMDRKISASDFDATTRYELHTRLDSIPKTEKLCHGDYNPSNVIIKKDGSAYILDWSHATQGNTSADAARTFLLFWLAGDSKGAEKYLQLYCLKTDTPKQQVQKWIPIVAASQSVKDNPDERELLASWVDVLA
ncbi:MAG: phosphotransferase [Clostridiales Family XIII bacterium]|jgi:tRNA A-37 threonylcarbamoyl transferase component Bud32|nr:phosphotransferase [Clostridiales Family XIII bacterium]